MKTNCTRTLCKSAEETLQLGAALGRTLRGGQVLAFTGDLGAGKTTFIKGLVSVLTHTDINDVSSPTFAYVNTYSGPTLNVHHFDLYRLKTADDFFALGFDEYFDAGGICCIEWPEIITDHLPTGTIFVEIQYLAETNREITIS